MGSDLPTIFRLAVGYELPSSPSSFSGYHRTSGQSGCITACPLASGWLSADSVALRRGIGGSGGSSGFIGDCGWSGWEERPQAQRRRRLARWLRGRRRWSSQRDSRSRSLQRMVSRCGDCRRLIVVIVASVETRWTRGNPGARLGFGHQARPILPRQWLCRSPG